MDFIMDNYVWFIVIGVIIIMAIIGYIADKTDFGRKNQSENNEKIKEKKKVKKEKKVKEVKPTKIEVDAKGINELSQDVTDKNFKNDNVQINDVANNETNVNVDLSADTNVPPVDNAQFTSPNVNETIDQSLFAPLTEQTQPIADTAVMDNTNSSFTENNGVSELIEEKPEDIDNNQNIELENVTPATLPEVTDENTKKTEPVAEEEDIWKF